MKKFISLILIIAMIACLVSGCKQINNKTSQKANPPLGSNSSNTIGFNSQNTSMKNAEITKVIAPYDVIETINSYESNEDILMILFGWADELDYSQYIKVESKDKGYKEVQYMDKEQTTKFGWSVKEINNTAEYTYHFLDDKEKEIIINRDNLSGKSNIVSISTQNNHINRIANIQMFLPTDGSMRGVSILNQKQNYENDGLYVERAQENDLVMMYEVGYLLDYYFYVQKVLLQDEHHFYGNPDISSLKKVYYVDGKLKSEYSELNGMLDGKNTTYFEDGTIKESSDWKSGKLNGTKTTYYASGKFQMITEYIDNNKHGQYTQFYDNDTNHIMEIGMYDTNKQNGIWSTYNSDGTLKSEIIWDHGVAK